MPDDETIKALKERADAIERELRWLMGDDAPDEKELNDELAEIHNELGRLGLCALGDYMDGAVYDRAEMMVQTGRIR
jgi:hypothetical protein